MFKITTCFLALMAPLCAENLFDNSTMDTTGGWKGSKKYIKEGETLEFPKTPAKDDPAAKDKANRCLLLTAKAREQVSFSQEISTKGLKDLTLKLRYRTKNYVGRGFVLRGKRADGGFTFTDRTLEVDGKWHEMTWDFSYVQGSNKIEFVFVALEGTGDIYFDDITLEPARK